MFSHHVHQRAATAILACSVFGFSFETFAQVLAIEEIVVTTRKREENLQDVPLVITAFTADVLERKGLDNLEDVARLTAGVIYDEGEFPQDIRVVIRGLSPTRGRPNVAILQDGIDISSEGVESAGGSLLINPRLFDMERVEVVKGPQSSLFGRSAFAGAINYVTRKPTNEWENKVSMQFGERRDLELAAAVYGPLQEDKVLIGLNAAYWEFDGFYNNAVTGGDLGGTSGVGISGTTIFNLTEDASFTFRAEYTDDEFDVPPVAFVTGNTQVPLPAAALGTVISPAVPTISQFIGEVPDADGLLVTVSENPRTGEDYPGSERNVLRLSGTLEWDLEWGSLTSLTHWADADTFQFLENRRIGSLFEVTTATEFNVNTDTELISQEIRLASSQDGGLRWLIGGLYWDENITQESRNHACLNNQLLPFLPILPCGPFLAAISPIESVAPNIWIRNTEHWSAFGSIEFDVTDEITFAVEGRYTDEKLFVQGPSGTRIIDALGLFGPPNVMPGPTPTIGANDDDSFFTPRFTIEYEPNEDMLLYASLAKGAKPSGISTVGAGAGGFDPELFAFDRETIWVYELGAKTSWADGRVIANGAVYYEDFKEKQSESQVLRSNNLLGTKIVNASDAEIIGFELDVGWAPTDELNFSLGYAYTDSEYKDFVVTAGGPATIASVGNCNPVTIGGETVCEVDRTGNELEDVSKHSLVLGGSFRAPLAGDVDWLIETDIQYQDNRFDRSDNRLIMPGYWLVDLRLGIAGENWDVIAYGDNLFDDDTVKTAFAEPDFQTISLAVFPPPFTFVLANALQARLPDKQQFGVRATYRF